MRRLPGEDIYGGKITLEEANEDQSDLADKINEFNKKTRPKSDRKKQKREIVKENLYNFFEAREIVLNVFKSKILQEQVLQIILNLKD